MTFKMTRHHVSAFLVGSLFSFYCLISFSENAFAQTQPGEVQTFGTKPAEVKPIETKPVDVKPVDVKPIEVKPSGTSTNKEAADTKEVQPAEGQQQPQQSDTIQQPQQQKPQGNEKIEDEKVEDKPQVKPEPKADLLKAPYENWQTTIATDHPLVGKIWSTQEGAFITPEDLVSRVAYRDYILLGETHDNPDHHRLQAWIIQKMLKFDRQPTIVMEMIEQNQDDELKAYFSSAQRNSASSLGAALKWTERGWPEWKIYQPIAEVALQADLPIATGNANREDVKAVAKKGLVHIEPEKRAKLGLNISFAPLSNSMKELLNASHCYMMSNADLIPMAMAQRFQDAVMADSLIRAGQKKGAVLIAGSGHVRTDSGVPYYLLQRQPEKRVAAVMMAEVEVGKQNPADFLPKDAGAKPAIDYIWFTPRQDRPDPCEQLRKHLKK